MIFQTAGYFAASKPCNVSVEVIRRTEKARKPLDDRDSFSPEPYILPIPYTYTRDTDVPQRGIGALGTGLSG